MSYQRARSDDQINDRKQEIVDAAAYIYDTFGYEGLTFSSISEHTKITRPSIYKYFKTKDEILLILLRQDLQIFIDSLIGSFKLNRIYSLKEITEIWTETLIIHHRLLDLYAILFTLVENNVSVEALATFKKEVLTIQAPLVDFSAQFFPNATLQQLQTFIYFQLIFAFGLYPVTKLSPLQEKAVALSGVAFTPPNFREVYQTCFYQQVYCLANDIT